MKVFEPGWQPMLSGERLPACDLIADIVSNDLHPNPHNPTHRQWSKVHLTPSINRYPVEVREALWECVLAIWRLQLKQEEGVCNSQWVCHMTAWLVSYLNFYGS